VKIVHLLGWYFPDSVGGTEVYVEGLCRRLRAAGHEVLIAAPDSRGLAAERYEHDGVPVFRYSIPAEPTRDEAYHRVPTRGAEKLYAWLERERPDLLHVHSVTTGVGLPELKVAARLNIRVIATCHLPGLGYMCRTGELMQWGRFPCDGIVIPDKCAACSLTRLGLPEVVARVVGAVPVSLSARLRVLPGRFGTSLGMSASVVEYQGMQRELLGLMEAFVVLNETARQMLIADGAPVHKIVVNRLGISQTGIVRKPGPDRAPTGTPVRFGYLGRLNSVKGLMELARAVRAIPQDIPFELQIRGPQLDDAARRFADELKATVGDDRRVRFEPAVPARDVPRVLADLDVLLCPSIWFENGPTIALEAMAVGTPVIGSRVGNLAEIVNDGINGRLVAAGDVDAWKAALVDVASNPATTIDVWRRALTDPRTMDDIARDYLDLYTAPPLRCELRS
jgi:glycosyltransferase involved in cell wall biosynthesis